jgi:hypothetical protein
MAFDMMQIQLENDAAHPSYSQVSPKYSELCWRPELESSDSIYGKTERNDREH